MQLILVVFNSAIEDEMEEALKKAGMRCFTRVPTVHGVGECSEPRLDSHIWPGHNTMYLVCIESSKKEKILEAVRRMKELHRAEGVKAFVLPVTDVV